MLRIYKSLTFFLSIFILIIFLRKILNKENNESFKKKLFPSKLQINKDKTKNLIWFHAASVGEAQSIIPLIKKILNKEKNVEILITTITQSSAFLMKKKFEKYENVKHRFFPLDIKFLIDRVFRWLETEFSYIRRL